jgi:hypothetical protein
MRSRKLRIGGLVSAIALFAGTVAPTAACGPFFTDDVFQFTAHPDLPLKKFAAGQLGVIRGTFARSYLIVAYRYLTEHPLSNREQSDIVKLWEGRIDSSSPAGSPDATNKWLAARKKLGGATKDVEIDVTRGVGKREDYGGFTNNFLNCPDAAFAKAADTLQAMVLKYGVSSEPVKEWLAAQDLVFAHCSDPAYDYNTKKVAPEPDFPKPLTAGDATEKANRAYQIACAHFYAEDFDQANKEFTDIASDTSSPWHELAPYLAARANLRKATLSGGNNEPELLKAVKAQLQKIASIAGNPAQGIADQLIGYVQGRLSPQERISELADKLAKADDAATFACDVDDFTTLYDRIFDSDTDDASDAAAKPAKVNVPDHFKDNDLVAWIQNMEDKPESGFAAARKKWQETHSLAWLVAAASKMGGKNYDAQVAEAAEKVPSTSAGYWPAMYFLADALSQTANKPGLTAGKTAASIADKMIAIASGAPPSAVNAFKDIQLAHVQDLNAFLSAAIQIPAGDSAQVDGTDMPDDFAAAENQKSGYYHVHPAFTTSGAAFVNTKAPLAVLLQLCTSDKVPGSLKLDVCQAAWTRAVLLNDDATVAKVTPMLLAARPALKKSLDAYTNAKSPVEKRFAAADMILLNPAMRPLITAGVGRPSKFNEVDDYQNNWWSFTDLEKKAPDPAVQDDASQPDQVNVNNFLTKTEQQTAAAQVKTLVKVGTGGDFILSACIAMMRKTPGDPRLPEALYHAIRAPKFSDHTAATTKLSHTAYDLMHAQYPKDPWTAKTKYWY